MADDPLVKLTFTQGCGDCGERRVDLPAPLALLGDDFDWDVRDYDGYRLFMLEELTARFPERSSWTPADMEVVLVETLSVVLDQLSDMNDRIQAESFLESARRPDTVRRMLEMIGYKPLAHIDPNMLELVDDAQASDNQRLEKLWSYYPHLMAQAKLAGPRSIHQQRRMVTLQDYRNQLLSHPLVLDVDAYNQWTGAWYTHYVVVRLIGNIQLDDALSAELLAADVEDVAGKFNVLNNRLLEYYQQQDMTPLALAQEQTPRLLLQYVIGRQRMIGQEVLLSDATLVGIVLSISIRIAGDFYRTEISDAVRQTLIDPLDGLFAPGKMRFGEDVVASNIIEVLIQLDGVATVCINRMKRIGSVYADQSGSGTIILTGHEVAVLVDNALMPAYGRLSLTLHGGKLG